MDLGFDAGLFGFGLIVGGVEGGVRRGVGGGGGGSRGRGDVPFGEAGFALAVLEEEESDHFCIGAMII